MARKSMKELEEEIEQVRKQLRKNEELMRRAAIKAIKLMAKIKQCETPRLWVTSGTTTADQHFGWQPASQEERAQLRTQRAINRPDRNYEGDPRLSSTLTPSLTANIG
jgi:hypothetical protein